VRHQAAARSLRTSPRTDAELMRGIADGDLASLGVLYDRHHEAVRQFLVRVLGRGHDAEDLTHEVFLIALRRARDYDGRSSARPLLVGIAVQLVRRRRRALRRWAEALAALAPTLAKAFRRTPEDAAADDEELTVFEDALALLTEDKRLVFLMVEREGFSGDDVARALGIPTPTVWTRLHRAHAALRRAVEKGRS